MTLHARAYAFVHRADVYFGNGDYDHAIADNDAALQIHPENYLAYDYRGKSYFQKGDYDRAITDYNEALNLNPKADEFYAGPRRCLFKKGRLRSRN